MWFLFCISNCFSIIAILFAKVTVLLIDSVTSNIHWLLGKITYCNIKIITSLLFCSSWYFIIICCRFTSLCKNSSKLNKFLHSEVNLLIKHITSYNKQLNCYGHVQRMNQERLPRRILEWCPPGRRRKGRPRDSWMQEVTTGMRERGIGSLEWVDREGWRKKFNLP